MFGGLFNAIGDLFGGGTRGVMNVANAAQNVSARAGRETVEAQRSPQEIQDERDNERARIASNRARLMRDYLNITGGVRDGAARSPSPVPFGRLPGGGRGVRFEGLDADAEKNKIFGSFPRVKNPPKTLVGNMFGGNKPSSSPTRPMGAGGGAPDNRSYYRR